MAEAAALPPFDPVAYPLWGVPFAVKDNIDVGGAPTTAACPAFAYAARAGCLCRGAVARGGGDLDRQDQPRPVRHGAGRRAVALWRAAQRDGPAIVPGGSSGSAVAVARGIVSFALGTDTAGSGRVPAALNNIVGLKPSLGALSATGVVPACRTLDTISIFALTVPDAWAAFRVACAYDAADAYARVMPAPPWRRCRLRCGWACRMRQHRVLRRRGAGGGL
jgi:allophanate hydrolase